MTPRGRPPLPPGEKAVNVTVKLYAEDLARLDRLAVVHGGKGEAVRLGLEALEESEVTLFEPGTLCVISDECSVADWHGRKVRVIGPGPRSRSWFVVPVDELPLASDNRGRSQGPKFPGERCVFPTRSLRAA